MTTTQNIEVTLTLNLPNSDIEDIAMASAASYWASVRHSRNPGTWGYVWEDDNLDGGTRVVTYNALRRAFERCIANKAENGSRLMGYPHEYFIASAAGAYKGIPDLGCIDDTAADILLQVAIFDQVVYG